MAKLDMVIDAVDGNNRVVGTVVRQQALGRENFRVVHVLVIDHRGFVLLQRIAAGLRHQGCWGSSAAGYLQAGETFPNAARRKLAEELRLLDVDLDEVGLTPMVDQGSTKFIGVFIARADGLQHAHSPDISALEYVAVPTVQPLASSGSKTFTPTFLNVLEFVIQRRGPRP